MIPREPADPTAPRPSPMRTLSSMTEASTVSASRRSPFNSRSGPWVDAGVALAYSLRPDCAANISHPSQAPRTSSAYLRLDFSADRRMRFTSERDTPNVRAMVIGFSPALNDARTRLAFPSGISILVPTGDDTGRDALGAEASLVLPIEVLCFRLTISASTVACSR